MRMKLFRARRMCLLALMLASAMANATSVSYYLDQTNTQPILSDGINYLQVTIADAAFELDANAIRFDVTILSPLTSIADTNFGIQAFGFNTNVPTDPVLAAIAGLPSGWSAASDRNQDGFGNFELVVSGTDSNRQNPTLTFYITGIAGDTPATYTAPSNGTAAEGNVFFAAQVTGFLDQDPGAGQVTSAYFGGSQAVPVPATAWLFVTGLAGLAAVGPAAYHALEHAGHEALHPRRVRRIRVGKLGTHESLFHGHLVPQAEETERNAEQAAERADSHPGPDQGHADAGVDRMADGGVRPVRDERVVFLDLHLRAPVVREYAARPDRKGNPGHAQGQTNPAAPRPAPARHEAQNGQRSSRPVGQQHSHR